MNIQYNTGAFNTGFKPKRQKFGIGAFILVLIIGAGFTGMGFAAVNGTKVDPGWTRVSGEVVSSSKRISDGSTVYTPIVEYVVDGHEHRATSTFGSSFVPTIGEEREVAYNPVQPDQAKVIESASKTWWLWLFPVIGVILLIAAPVALVRSLRRSSKINNLLQTGQKLQGVLTDVQSIGSNNRDYKIVVSATDPSGVVQSYVSDQIGGIGGLSLADFRSNPIPIDVYVDSMNPQNYYVDIADIPNLTPERIAELVQSATKDIRPQTIVNAGQPTAPPIDDARPPTSGVQL